MDLFFNLYLQSLNKSEMAETCFNFLLLMFGVKVLLKHCLLKVLRSVNHSTWCNYCRTMSRLIVPCKISTCEKVLRNYSKCNTKFQAVLSPRSSKRSIYVIYYVHVKFSFPFCNFFQWYIFVHDSELKYIIRYFHVAFIPKFPNTTQFK